jgi:hypothetical protein
VCRNLASVLAPVDEVRGNSFAVPLTMILMISDDTLRALAMRLAKVSGVVGVLLGGSRARGDDVATSDVDLGLYYRRPLDVAALGALAREVAGPRARVTEPGEWGPWVDGGSWLTIDGGAVDWIYRDMDRVRAAWADAVEGRFDFHFQVGHPLGVPDFAYAGEVALGIVLADPTGELTDLREQTQEYPRRLAIAVVDRLWEAPFLIQAARKAVSRQDTAYIAGCLFRVMGLCAHAVHARAGRWLINEKGAVVSAGRLRCAPEGFADQVHRLLGSVGTSRAELTAVLDAAATLVDNVQAACRAGC